MSRIQSEKTSLQAYEPEFILTAEDYELYIGRRRVEELKALAAPLLGKKWTNISSTLVGGGVAEMLRRLIPLARGLSVDASWYVLQGHEDFFKVTKKFHNLLQGLVQPLSLEEIFEAYLDTIDANAQQTCIVSDMIVIHDPQPAALIMNGVLFGNVLWRCHIDTSAPHRIVWRFLLPYINQCAGAIFTMPEFVGPGLHIPLYQMTPCIDPCAEKNWQYSDNEALDILSPLFHTHSIDPARPIFAAVSRYDIHKNQHTILKAFQRLRQERTFPAPPYLIFLGNTATDDPEGEVVLNQLREEAGDDPDVHIWVEDNNQLVGALMHLARSVIHVSTREGFGLVVSEALWQGTPVIGSRVGGITMQVLDGQTGYLVHPQDVDTIADRMARILDNPEEAMILGAQGREHVRQHFLLPELMKRYLMLLQFYTGKNHTPPSFRLNEIAYREIRHAVETITRCPGPQCQWHPSMLLERINGALNGTVRR